MSSEDDREAPNSAPDAKRALAVLAIVAAVIVASVAGVLVFARLRAPQAPPPREATGFERYRPGFESAMDKAGVLATFPDAPVELEAVEALGTHRFEATFTAEEVTALLNVYRSTGGFQGRDVSIEEAEVGFPAPGSAALAGTATLGDQTVNAEISGPVSYADLEIAADGPTTVRVEGFGVPAAQAQQATRLVVGYLNGYLSSAPGLQVLTAEVVDGGVKVTGVAPDRVEHPAAAP